MASVIVVGNEKGGAGKTTVAVNLAVLAATRGQDVLLVDADPGQNSSALWKARRDKSTDRRRAIRCVRLTGETIGTELEDLARRYETIVVDTGAEDSTELRGATLVADVLVVPIGPDPVDLWSVPAIATLFKRASKLNPKLRAVVALNRLPHQVADGATSAFWAWAANNAPAFISVAAMPLVARAAYARAFTDGLGVVELGRPDAKATAEITALSMEVHGDKKAARGRS